MPQGGCNSVCSGTWRKAPEAGGGELGRDEPRRLAWTCWLFACAIPSLSSVLPLALLTSKSSMTCILMASGFQSVLPILWGDPKMEEREVMVLLPLHTCFVTCFWHWALCGHCWYQAAPLLSFLPLFLQALGGNVFTVMRTPECFPKCCWLSHPASTAVNCLLTMGSLATLLRMPAFPAGTLTNIRGHNMEGLVCQVKDTAFLDYFRWNRKLQTCYSHFRVPLPSPSCSPISLLPVTEDCPLHKQAWWRALRRRMAWTRHSLHYFLSYSWPLLPS